MLEFNIFGIPYYGYESCDLSSNLNTELCSRWSSLAAFYPLSRNYYKSVNTDLNKKLANSARNALKTRYEILPYYYTLFYKAHLSGDTVIRPLFHEYFKHFVCFKIHLKILIVY